MKTLWSVLISSVLSCALSWGQANTGQAASQPSANSSTPERAQPAQHAIRIAPGSIIPVQLTKSVDAKKAKTGEEVTARVTQDLKASTGQVLIPKDTEILGHVTEAQARSKGEKESDLGLSFDRAVLKDGNNVPMPASIQAVIAPQAVAPNNNGGGTNAPAPPSNGGAFPSGGSRPGMEGGGTPPPSNVPPADQTGNAPSTQQASTRPPITAKTEGVVGLEHYKLLNSPDSKQGSVVSSDKSNVKLESGTLMLLRVNQ
ncbi:MAG TPA: hypothetical protein VMX38_11145 [Verrucomicrobiae bacterium]|jgi:hypothetical protein|nr:hypothetical protein [Verrucomicrobiae bacterium]